MKNSEFLELLENYNKHVFTISDAVKLTGKPRKYVSLILSKNNKFKRIERGKYYIKNTSVYEIASNIVSPSYISLISAFRYYNLITQMPNLIYVVSTKQHKNVELEGYEIKFVKFKRKCVLGYNTENGSFVASPEKAIVDALYTNLEFDYVSEAFGNIENPDIEMLKKYAIIMESKILVNKLGFLLESLGINADDLLKKRSSRYAILSLGNKINSKWRVKYA